MNYSLYAYPKSRSEMINATFMRHVFLMGLYYTLPQHELGNLPDDYWASYWAIFQANYLA